MRHTLFRWSVTIVAALFSAPGTLAQDTPPAPPAKWVAYAADLRFSTPGAPDTFGRQLQDEHGCTRREMVERDGSLQIVINNYETAKVYHLFRGNWSSRDIRVVPGMPGRMPVAPGRVGARIGQIDGFDVHELTMTVRSPAGETVQTLGVIPAANYLVTGRSLAGNRTESVIAVRLAPQAPADFLPPPSVTVTPSTASGGGTFLAVVVRLTFADRPPLEFTTTEERATPLKMPTGDELFLVTSIVDMQKSIVRVRLLRNASARVGDPREELGKVELALGATAEVVNPVENFTVTVTRVGAGSAR